MRTFLITLLLATIAATANAKDPARMFTSDDFKQLAFLEGRWQGTDPAGKAFFEQYDFADASTFRSQRFPSTAFSGATDSSTVTLKNGEVESRWGDFTWRASQLNPDMACFEPVNAPSSFCWKRAGSDTVEVVQRWQDADGKPQSMTMKLVRLR